MTNVLRLFGRKYRWRTILALRSGKFVSLVTQYLKGLAALAKYASIRNHQVVELLTFRSIENPIQLEHVQMVFASDWLRRCRPEIVHDIGSHRAWVIGIGAYYPVASLDVREPAIRLESENFLIGRAEHLPWADNSIEFLVSLHSIEHFGLGAYGDDLDAFGDHKSAKEMVRVLKPGGSLVLTTTATGGGSFTVFDAHRVYSIDELHFMFGDLEVVEEKYFSKKMSRWIERRELITEVMPYGWDLFLGVFRKKLQGDAS